MGKKSLKEYLSESIVTWVAPSGLEFRIRRIRDPLEFTRIAIKYQLMREDWEKLKGINAEELAGQRELLEVQERVLEKAEGLWAELFGKKVIYPKIVTGESDVEAGLLSIKDMTRLDKMELMREILTGLAGEEADWFRKPTGPAGAGADAGGESGADG